MGLGKAKENSCELPPLEAKESSILEKIEIRSRGN